RLLMALAGGVENGSIGETGTGCGVGLAWLVSGRVPGTSAVGIEDDAEMALGAAELFEKVDDVELVWGDAVELSELGPFDLLVLDGGPRSGGHGSPFVDPGRVLTPTGLLVIDGFARADRWPPVDHEGAPDTAREHWLAHPALWTTEVTIAPREVPMSVLLARRVPPGF
ncbi:MAG: SAM-dependent methyltransferase, partial [Acidimicrobiales bacterium]